MGCIVLFDVDGTLIGSGGAGVRALDAAFREVFGILDGMDGIICDGKTDPAIVREVLATRALDSRANIERILESYVGHLSREVLQAEGYQVLPGVQETLELLQDLPDVVCGLATGNLETGARAKLERAGLNRFFPVGGYGSDAEERGELVRIGIRRADRLLRHRRTDESGHRAVVVGDTPRDIAAAHAASAVAVGVATGHFSARELADCSADLVLSDLTDPATWIRKLGIGVEKAPRIETAK